MPHQEEQVRETSSLRKSPCRVEPSVQLDLHGFLTELREWIEAIEAGKWDTASERLRDACDEAYCLEGWKEFTNRLGTSNMEHHVHNLRRFLVAVETTARSHELRRDASSSAVNRDDRTAK
ncbi:MAG: hypothetical protein RIC55_32595 [Pirellulaceae bacterium]